VKYAIISGLLSLLISSSWAGSPESCKIIGMKIKALESSNSTSMTKINSLKKNADKNAGELEKLSTQHQNTSEMITGLQRVYSTSCSKT